MNARAYLWWQRLLTLAILLIVALNVGLEKGRIFTLSWMVVLFVLIISAILSLTLSSHNADVEARVSNASFVGGLALLCWFVASLVSPKNPRTVFLFLAVLLFPVAMVATQLLLSNAGPSKVAKGTLLEMAERIANLPRREAAAGDNSSAVVMVDPESQVMYSVESTDSRVVVAFWGTRTSAQWSSNLNIGSARLSDGSRVHAGWKELFDKLLPKLNVVLQNAQGGKDVPVFVVGHSLGGIMAQMLVHAKVLPNPTTLIIYGSPTAGDGQFVKSMTSGLVDYANVILPFDPIPALMNAVFVPLGNEVLVMPYPPNRLFMETHNIKHYVSSLAKDPLTALLETALFMASLIVALTAIVNVTMGLPLRLPLRILLLVVIIGGAWVFFTQIPMTVPVSLSVLILGIAAMVLSSSTPKGARAWLWDLRNRVGLTRANVEVWKEF
jgi:hypothetical protein